jgi:hypothetical protein
VFSTGERILGYVDRSRGNCLQGEDWQYCIEPLVSSGRFAALGRVIRVDGDEHVENKAGLNDTLERPR